MVDKTNKLDKIETIKNYIEVYPYGNTFLDNTIESLKLSLIETKNLYKPNCSFSFTSKDGRFHSDAHSHSNLTNSGEAKKISIIMHDLTKERKMNNGDVIQGGYIPIPNYVSTKFDLRAYCGTSNDIEYAMNKKDYNERIVVIKNLERDQEFEFDTSKICGMSIEIENKFDFSLYLSGLSNMIKKNKFANKSLDEMISIFTYDFLNTIYSKYEITTIFDYDFSLNSYKYKTSLNPYSEVFVSDLFYKHDLLYSINEALSYNFWSKNPISKELMAYQYVSLLNETPIDMSIAIMDESIKFSNYIKEHLNFLYDISK